MSCPPVPGRSPTRYSPVRHSPPAEAGFACDLHALGTPPAFILSQDQTLQNEEPPSEEGNDLTSIHLTQRTGHHDASATPKGRGNAVLPGPRCDGNHCQILPAIQMLMCAAALEATNKDATKRWHGRQPPQASSGNILVMSPRGPRSRGVRRVTHCTTMSRSRQQRGGAETNEASTFSRVRAGRLTSDDERPASWTAPAVRRSHSWA